MAVCEYSLTSLVVTLKRNIIRLLTFVLSSLENMAHTTCRFVPGATCITCNDVSAAREVVYRALRNQTIETTCMSLASSRITTLFFINIVRGRAVVTGPPNAPTPAEDQDKPTLLHARLTMVVMQGSEVATSIPGRRREASSSKTALRVLNRVVHALRAKTSHVPFV